MEGCRWRATGGELRLQGYSNRAAAPGYSCKVTATGLRPQGSGAGLELQGYGYKGTAILLQVQGYRCRGGQQSYVHLLWGFWGSHVETIPSRKVRKKKEPPQMPLDHKQFGSVFEAEGGN